MKKILFLLVFYLTTFAAFADEFPWVKQIMFRDSTVWIAVNDGLYKINIKKSGKIDWKKEDKNSTNIYIDKYNRLWKISQESKSNVLYLYKDETWIQQKEKVKYIFEDNNELYISVLQDTYFKYNKDKWIETNIQIEQNNYYKTAYVKKYANMKKLTRDTTAHHIITYTYDKEGDIWAIQTYRKGRHEYEDYLCQYKNNKWEKKSLFPENNGISTIFLRDNGEIWVGGYAFVAYYYNEMWTRIFFLDEYEFNGTDIVIVDKEEDIPVINDDELNNEELARLYGDSAPDAVYFADGRKIGFIQDADGYVNFRKQPNGNSEIHGIILSNVRVFYWDDKNTNWWKVEVNNIKGYVHKSRIKQLESS
ncbi:MAG: SH3 domain-containing protein [Prevotellaceae bacterium]|jgi:hypothetical protein|nr:SH3 domain-containing protein [Prevotellaceae bacterium]